jgi:hypothetical protein
VDDPEQLAEGAVDATRGRCLVRLSRGAEAGDQAGATREVIERRHRGSRQRLAVIRGGKGAQRIAQHERPSVVVIRQPRASPKESAPRQEPSEAGYVAKLVLTGLDVLRVDERLKDCELCRRGSPPRGLAIDATHLPASITRW